MNTTWAGFSFSRAIWGRNQSPRPTSENLSQRLFTVVYQAFENAPCSRIATGPEWAPRMHQQDL